MLAVIKNKEIVTQKINKKTFYAIKDNGQDFWVDRNHLYNYAMIGAISNVQLESNRFLPLLNPQFVIKKITKPMHKRFCAYVDFMFKKFEEENKDNIDRYYFYEEFHFLEYWRDYNNVLKKEVNGNVYFLFYGNSFCGIICEKKELGVSFVNYASIALDMDISKEYSYLFKTMPNSVISVSPDTLSNIVKRGLCECNKKSTINPEYTYSFLTSYMTAEQNKNIIVKAVENKLKEQRKLFNKHNVVFNQFNRDELLKKLGYNIYSEYRGNWVSYSGQYVFTGFHYVSIQDLTNSYVEKGNEPMYLVAEDGHNNIIGVLKYGYYGKGKGRHLAIAYVDVHCLYRREGIATDLLKELNKRVNKGEFIELSIESEEGKLCHMHDLSKRILTNALPLTYEEYLERNLK